MMFDKATTASQWRFEDGKLAPAPGVRLIPIDIYGEEIQKITMSESSLQGPTQSYVILAQVIRLTPQENANREVETPPHSHD